MSIAIQPNPIAASQPAAEQIGPIKHDRDADLAALEIVGQLDGADVAPDPRPLETAAAPHQAINAIGCALTAIVMVVFAVTKFSEGAWVVVVLIPLLVLGFFRIHQHYQGVKRALSLQARPLVVRSHPLETIVLVNDVHQGTFQMISYAESLGKPWVAVHVAVRPEKTARVLEKWNKHLGDRGHLHVLPSPYRSLTGPIVRLVKEVKREHPDAFVNIIMAQLVTDSFMGQLLHRNSGPMFKFAFQQMQGVAVTDVHYRVSEHADLAKAPAE